MTSLPLHQLVDTSGAVAATRSRKEKTAAIGALLEATDPAEAALLVSLLAGDPRQGRIGIGWATIGRLDHAPADRASLTIADVDATLDEIAAIAGAGSTDARGAALAALFARATPPEADFLQRLLLGELRQGANEGMVVEGLAKGSGVKAAAIRRALMLSGDLGLVATAAMTDGAEAVEGIGLQLGRPMRPMLASTAANVAEAVDALGRVSVEWKLDGARIQVHRRGSDVAVWTRNLNEITPRIPAVVEIVRGLPGGDLVLDGEVLGWADDEQPQAFQDTMSSFGASTRASSGLRPNFFDLLHLDGEDLVDTPLEQRRASLERICGPHTVPGIVTEDPEAAGEVLATALENGHEGVMVKSADSSYEAGRRGKTWRKIKPVHTLDLVVIAVEWGHGRRQGWLSNLHLGASDGNGGFVMVGKTFKGLTDELLAWQTEQLLARRVSEHGITVHVRPELVVEIALDGVQTSTRYPGGVALRFARVKQYRPDKDPAEADTIETVQSMR